MNDDKKEKPDCGTCDGKGRVRMPIKSAPMSTEYEWVTCPRCKGTGKEY